MADYTFKPNIPQLPTLPGIYRFYNADGQIIYVGKAKNIRKRVTSYYSKTTGVNFKTIKMISEATAMDYAVANSEFDALLLENNIIKETQPKYNILLKDDKTFPYICILRERFPRIISTRKYNPEAGEFFGPFSSVTAMKNVLELIRRLYAIRTCSFNLSQENIEKGKFKVCLEYHIGNCLGPCEGFQNEEDYMREIGHARNILKGNIRVVENHLKAEMNSAAAALNFERAQQYKEKLDTLEKFQSKSLVVNRDLTDIDVISLTNSDDFAYVNFFVLKEGAIIYSRTLELKKKLDEPDEEVISLALQQLRSESHSESRLVLSNIPIGLLPGEIENTIPKVGDKKKLVALSLKNALQLKIEREMLRAEKLTKSQRVLELLRKDLRLANTPNIIECFDNSNFQGTTPVASMVRFVNGKADKKNYRHFNIKTVTGPDDFASMKEIVGRRYTRLLEGNSPLPDLILIDGGKGQLNSAVEALEALGLTNIPIVGIAKRMEELFKPGDPLPLYINKKSESLLLLQQIRNEAHRFAITFHRQKRSKASISSELDTIQGIGKGTQEKLLTVFKSVKKIREASLEDLESVVGKQKAALIKGIKKGA